MYLLKEKRGVREMKKTFLALTSLMFLVGCFGGGKSMGGGNIAAPLDVCANISNTVSAASISLTSMIASFDYCGVVESYTDVEALLASYTGTEEANCPSVTALKAQFDAVIMEEVLGKEKVSNVTSFPGVGPLVKSAIAYQYSVGQGCGNQQWCFDNLVLLLMPIRSYLFDNIFKCPQSGASVSEAKVYFAHAYANAFFTTFTPGNPTSLNDCDEEAFAQRILTILNGGTDMNLQDLTASMTTLQGAGCH